MKSTLLWAMVVLNVAMLCTFIGRFTHENTVRAADPAPGMQRRMGDYLVVSGDVNGTASGVVYILDTSNDLLGAMAYDDSRNTIETMPTIGLKKIFDTPIPAKR